MQGFGENDGWYGTEKARERSSGGYSKLIPKSKTSKEAFAKPLTYIANHLTDIVCVCVFGLGGG